MGEKNLCGQENVDKINYLKEKLEKALEENEVLKLKLDSLYGSQNVENCNAAPAKKKLNEMSCEELHEKAGEIDHEICIRDEQNHLKLAKINIMKYYSDASDEYMVELDQIGDRFPDIILSLDGLINLKNTLDTARHDLFNENKYLRERVALLEQIFGVVDNNIAYPVLDINETLKTQRKVFGTTGTPFKDNTITISNANDIKYGKYKIGR